MQINRSKCSFSKRSIRFLGHVIEEGTLRPDPLRYQALLNMPEPTDLRQLNRMIGLFAYYAKWILNCTELTLHSTKCRENFHRNGLTDEAQQSIHKLKEALVKSVLIVPDPNQPLMIETDASDIALGGTLLQSG